MQEAIKNVNKYHTARMAEYIVRGSGITITHRNAAPLALVTFYEVNRGAAVLSSFVHHVADIVSLFDSHELKSVHEKLDFIFSAAADMLIVQGFYGNVTGA